MIYRKFCPFKSFFFPNFELLTNKSTDININLIQNKLKSLIDFIKASEET